MDVLWLNGKSCGIGDGTIANLVTIANLGWRCGVVVTHWVKSTKLLYGRPG